MKNAEEILEEANALLSAGEPEAVLPLVLPLAEAGDSSAQFLVGFFYALSCNRTPPGLGAGEAFQQWLESIPRTQWDAWREEDEPKALHWYIKAGEQGHPEAVLQAKGLSERLHVDLPWKEATGRRRQLLDLAEAHGAMMLAFVPLREQNGLSDREYLRKHMGKP